MRRSDGLSEFPNDLPRLHAGSLTGPPALAFVNNLASSDAPNLSYVTVYPLTTLLRILLVQVLALNPGSLKAISPVRRDGML